MVIKQRVKLTRVNENGKKQNITVEFCGRSQEELIGRVEKHLNKYFQKGWNLR